MKVSLNWLKEFVEVDIDPRELANRLTMAGHEVVETKIIGAGWDKVFIAEVLAINPHPNADRLRLPTVKVGENRAYRGLRGA